MSQSKLTPLNKFKEGDIVIGVTTSNLDFAHRDDSMYEGRIGVVRGMAFIDAYDTYEYQLGYPDNDYWYFLEQDLQDEKNKIIHDILKDL